eukprot:16243_5
MRVRKCVFVWGVVCRLWYRTRQSDEESSCVKQFIDFDRIVCFCFCFFFKKKKYGNEGENEGEKRQCHRYILLKSKLTKKQVF